VLPVHHRQQALSGDGVAADHAFTLELGQQFLNVGDGDILVKWPHVGFDEFRVSASAAGIIDVRPEAGERPSGMHRDSG